MATVDKGKSGADRGVFTAPSRKRQSPAMSSGPGLIGMGSKGCSVLFHGLIAVHNWMGEGFDGRNGNSLLF
jgi:hypothetical protein